MWQVGSSYRLIRLRSSHRRPARPGWHIFLDSGAHGRRACHHCTMHTKVRRPDLAASRGCSPTRKHDGVALRSREVLCQAGCPNRTCPPLTPSPVCPGNRKNDQLTISHQRFQPVSTWLVHFRVQTIVGAFSYGGVRLCARVRVVACFRVAFGNINHKSVNDRQPAPHVV